jgi:hypothetical protein
MNGIFMVGKFWGFSPVEFPDFNKFVNFVNSDKGKILKFKNLIYKTICYKNKKNPSIIILVFSTMQVKTHYTLNRLMPIAVACSLQKIVVY